VTAAYDLAAPLFGTAGLEVDLRPDRSEEREFHGPCSVALA